MRASLGTNKKAVADLLRRYGLSGAVALGVIGICGLTTMTTNFTDKLATSTNMPPAVHVSPAAKSQPSLNKQEATELSTLSTPSTATGSNSSASESSEAQAKQSSSAPAKAAPATTLAATPACDSVKQITLTRSRNAALSAEATHHHLTIWALQSTGVITRSLNPSMYNYQMSKENSRHEQAVTSIQKQYIAGLRQAHC